MHTVFELTLVQSMFKVRVLQETSSLPTACRTQSTLSASVFLALRAT